MHVLQLLPRVDVGGVERGVLDLAEGLIARGHRVSVVSRGGSLRDRLTELGAMHYELPVHEKSLPQAWGCVKAVSQLITASHVDVVHARSRVPAWIGWMAARRTQRPFITTAHGFYAPHAASRVMLWGRTIIVPSEALARYLVDQFHVPSQRLRMIPRGVNLREFVYQPPAAGAPQRWRIGLIGRLSPMKGHAVALRACAQLLHEGLPVTFCLAGDPPGSPERRALDMLAASLQVSGAVEWLGMRQDIPSVIASLDLVIVPSTYPESFGRGVIEAQAVGRPVVASRIGALPELIDDGRTGLLVPPGHPQALADALKRLIKDEVLRARCSTQGRQAVETSWHADRMVEQTLAVYDEVLTRPRIVVWKLGALGDVILSTPSLRAIRRQFPHARISLVVGREAYEPVARCPYVNDMIIVDRKRRDRGIRGQLAFCRALRAQAFDRSIDLQNSRWSHTAAWLAGVPVRIGYRRKFGRLLNCGVRLPRVVLAPVAHQHHLLRSAGVATDGVGLEIWPSTHDDEAAARLLRSTEDDGRPLVGLHPGGSGRWKTKRWDIARWTRLCDALQERHVRVVVTCGESEQELGEAIRRQARSNPLVLIGQTSLMELACIMRRCALFITHDSAPLHLAAAVGTPVVGLFGPTDPRRHLPPSFRGQVMSKPVFCSPCYSPRCLTLTHACMTRITVDEVLSTVLGLLAEQEEQHVEGVGQPQ